MENIEERKIEIGQETLKILNTIRKWTMFLAILGFIGIGVLLIAGIFTGTFLIVFNTSDADKGLTEILFFSLLISLALIYFFPVFYMFRFSKNTSEAVRNIDREKLHKAFKNLKAFYVYIGILVITILVLYVIFFLTLGASLSFLKNLDLGHILTAPA
jgi:formate hydrogenlyase subunit 3/multisubunit Na+/H+ antiporter MnhD subunit